MLNRINSVDICCGLAWGDEAKGKIIAELSRTGLYDFVCRWAGGNNAGHTVYVNQKKYKTHLIPCGIFYNIKSIIGPDCVINVEAFYKEVQYLKDNGFNTDLIKISRSAQVITDAHIEEDKAKLVESQGSTSKGIAPCYSDKYRRVGVLASSIIDLEPYLWDGYLYGNILCEGAQGYWLDISHGNYPYVTSSTTLPYGACSLGFPPQKIRTIYGAAKIYDTRSGIDPLFPETLLDNPELSLIIEEGREYGTTTGRKRKVNWLNLDMLIQATFESGTTDLIISKVDVLEKLKLFKLFFNNKLEVFDSLENMQNMISLILLTSCAPILKNIHYSNNPYNIKTVK